ncbi:MAG: SDR family oxidoreductase [Trueperaceae bacterium]
MTDDANPRPSSDAGEVGGAPTPPRVAVISGAAGGVGGAVARTFTERGCRLVLPARSDPASLQAAFQHALVVEADLTDPDACRRVADRTEAELGACDAVVHLAGGFGMRSALTLTASDLETQLSINLRTAVHLTSAFLPGMAERGRGAVVGVSSGAAASGGASLGAYAAAKAALEGYLRSVRAELAAKGLSVSLLIPIGPIDTPANRDAMPNADPHDWIAPLGMAEAAWYLASGGDGGRGTELRLTP